ncbi:MAG: DUF3046 domain-containing protein [Mycetocola sp.]
MKLSEFKTAMTTEFGGAYGRVLANDLVLRELDGKTANEALAAGRAPREVWLAICRETDVPVERRHGAGVPPPRS